MTGVAKRLADATLALVAGADEYPTMTEVDNVLKSLTGALKATAAHVAEARAALHTRLILSMEKGVAVAVQHERWLHRKTSSDKYYWERYRKLLLLQGWGPSVIRTMDQTVDEILDYAGDPTVDRPFDRRGLVVGDVQSGKTAAYIALCNKAADAGYVLIILLAGSLNSLRYQTQQRLDEGFIGFDSVERVAGKPTAAMKPIGVGRFDGSRSPHAYTSKLSDFDVNASKFRVRLNGLTEPVLMVVKKNKTILDNLSAYLSSQQPAAGGKLDIPLLFIDDEADNASVNTRKEEDPRGINSAIRNILQLFNRSSYVGFTATPFANVFISPDAYTDNYGADIFPRDYIYSLEAPSNYVGPRRIFVEHRDQFIREVIDGEEIFPQGHKKEHEVSVLPESLIEALRCFMLTNVFRDFRGQGAEHRTMLVNVSWANAVQSQVEDLLSREIELYRNEISTFASLSDADACLQSKRLQALRDTFSLEFETLGVPWPTIQAGLFESTRAIEVRSINMRSKKSLDYDANRANGLRVVAVGGNALSRGLTLEGLNVSYLLRNSQAYDTLMQMGRWFGYRPGYEDLCRIYMSPEAASWYEHITGATEELRLELRRMHDLNRTPAEFGLRVQSHPDKLIVTARNKMRSASEVVDGKVSLKGRRLEGTWLPASPQALAKNRDVMLEVLDAVRAAARSEASPKASTKLWREVPYQVIARCLSQFDVRNLDFQNVQIADSLIKQPDEILKTWDVALVAGDGDVRSLRLKSGQLECKPVLRKIEKRSSYLEIHRRRLGSGSDEALGLGKDEIAAAEAKWQAWRLTKSASGSEHRVLGWFYREQRSRPMLYVYVIDPSSSTEDTGFVNPPVDVFCSIAISFPQSLNDTDSSIVYQANKVYRQMLLTFEAEVDEDLSSEEAESAVN